MLGLAAATGNAMIDNEMSENPKHLRAQAAIDPQSPAGWSHGFALSHGFVLSQAFVLGGQQSGMSAVADMSPVCAGTNAAPAPAAGSTATDTAIRSARMVRARFMSQLFSAQNCRPRRRKVK
jgi:hypothetical protein